MSPSSVWRYPVRIFVSKITHYFHVAPCTLVDSYRKPEEPAVSVFRVEK
jgi:hypothetical protein